MRCIWKIIALIMLTVGSQCVCIFVQADFDKAGAQIVVVSFGSCSAAVQWQKETSCQYPILLDYDRQVGW